jgi:hypothetical protein
MSDELKELRGRIARLEAKEACISTFNEYLHYLDGEFTEDLLDLFAPDAELDVMNYPPGSGDNLSFHGRQGIRPLYKDHHGIMSRHHSANVTVNVHPDCTTAELSAYFVTAINYGLTGGIYEARLKPLDTKWRFTWLRISSNWGWVLPQKYPPFLTDSLGAGALRKGRPVLYIPSKPEA